MVWIPALSFQEQVERVGAYAGIASFFGIALLAVLYFAQARELKRLRDWAGRAPERARELEERVAEDAARRAEEQARVAVPAPSGASVAAVPAGAQVAATNNGASDGAAAPGAVSGEAPEVDAAASGEATPVAPANGVAQPVGEVADADASAEMAATEAQRQPAGGDETPSDAVATGPADEAPGDVHPDGAAAPPVVAAAADGEATPEGPAAVPATGAAAAAAGAGSQPAEADDVEKPAPSAPASAAPEEPTGAPPATMPAGPRPATAAALRVGAPPARTASRPAPLTPVAPRPRRRGRGTLIGLGLAGVLAAGGVAFALSADGGEDPAPEPNVAQTPTPTATPTPDVTAARQATTVAVLNGTTTNGLAARLVEKLTAAGYQEGPRGNYADQQRATSVVLYREGAEDRARDAASVLDIADVAPLDAQTAAQPIGDAEVVVVAGHDQAP